MDRIILAACATVVIVNIYSQMVLANPGYDSSLYASRYKDDDSKVIPLWFAQNLGRRKRNLKNSITQQELVDVWDVLLQSPKTLVTIDGNDKFICRSTANNKFYLVEGADKADFTPRLGRNIEELTGNEKWLRDIVTAEVDERSPPFAPRLGRRLSAFSPRLGREA